MYVSASRTAVPQTGGKVKSRGERIERRKVERAALKAEPDDARAQRERLWALLTPTQQREILSERVRDRSKQ